MVTYGHHIPVGTGLRSAAGCADASRPDHQQALAWEMFTRANAPVLPSRSSRRNRSTSQLLDDLAVRPQSDSSRGGRMEGLDRLSGRGALTPPAHRKVVPNVRRARDRSASAAEVRLRRRRTRVSGHPFAGRRPDGSVAVSELGNEGRVVAESLLADLMDVVALGDRKTLGREDVIQPIAVGEIPPLPVPAPPVSVVTVCESPGVLIQAGSDRHDL